LKAEIAAQKVSSSGWACHIIECMALKDMFLSENRGICPSHFLQCIWVSLVFFGVASATIRKCGKPRKVGKFESNEGKSGKSMCSCQWCVTVFSV